MNTIESQPTYKRQRFLLAFVRQLGTTVTATDLQKLVFLHTMSGDSDYYEFVPYKFGSYSFQLSEDLDILQRDGYLALEHQQNSTRIKAIGEFSSNTFLRIDPERGNALIRRAYRKYPYYAINSEIVGKLFQGEELKRFSNGKNAYAKAEQLLFSIGYEGKSIEAFINTLIRNDVRLLCDVRKNPLSRKFGFSKGKLEHITQTVGIKYIHIPDLGVDSDKRSALKTKDDYQRLFDDYEKSLSSRKLPLESLYKLLQDHTRIALMCFEREPEMCHRYIIRDYIVKAHKVRSADI